MALDTSKTLTKVTYNGVEFPLASGGGSAYRITTAELPNTTINLSFAGSIMQSATTDVNTGGKVSFDVDETGTYTVIALNSDDVEIWSQVVVVEEIGEYIVKSGKGLANYTPDEMHTALQGGYFSIMFSLQDTFILVKEGNILNNHKFFVEKITQLESGKEIVDFRMANQYTGGTYNINPRYAHLSSSTATSWTTDYSSNGGYKYSEMRKRMMKMGESVYSQAQSIKPNDSSVSDGIPFSEMKYTDTSTTSAIYSYDKATDTFTPLTSWQEISERNTYFVKGYFKSVGTIDESTFNSGNYYTYNTSTYVYTPATTYSSGTTYYGFYEHLQEDGIFANALNESGFGSNLVRFNDKASAGLNQQTYVNEFSDYADIPAVEEFTGTNRTTILMSGRFGTGINSYNIAGEATKKPAYTEFGIQATGSIYWTRSANSANTNSFCTISNSGDIYSISVVSTSGVRLGFRLS